MTNILRIFTVAIAATSLSAAAEAATFDFSASLSGAAESPPVASAGSGSVSLTYDDVAQTLAISAMFQNLTGTTTVAHIHAPTAMAQMGNAGVASQTPTFMGFPAGVTTGTFNMLLDLTSAASYNPTFLITSGGTAAGAQAALVQSLNERTAYFNIHTTTFGAGEIRGFFAPAVVPVPASLPLLAAPLLVLAAIGRARRRQQSA